MDNSTLVKNPEYTPGGGTTWENHEEFLANNKEAYDNVNIAFPAFFPVPDTSNLVTKAEQDRTGLFS